MIKKIGNTLFFYDGYRFRKRPNKGLLNWGKFWMLVMDRRQQIGEKKENVNFFHDVILYCGT